MAFLPTIPGVPSLLNPAQMPSPGPLLNTDGTIPSAPGQGAKWGIYTAGSTVVLAIAPDSIIDLNFRGDWRVSNAPQEQGAFQSYNKVANPNEIRVRMTKGGTLSDRQTFLKDVEAAAASLDLYDVVTPEKTYINVNIARVDYWRKAESGVGLLTVDIMLVEIRVAGSPQFTKTIAPSSVDPIKVGTVQTKPPISNQQAVITKLDSQVINGIPGWGGH